jgi:hypothetical protein
MLCTRRSSRVLFAFFYYLSIWLMWRARPPSPGASVLSFSHALGTRTWCWFTRLNGVFVLFCRRPQAVQLRAAELLREISTFNMYMQFRRHVPSVSSFWRCVGL